MRRTLYQNVCIAMLKTRLTEFLTSPGILGYQIHFDENGDAEFNLTLLDLKMNGTFACGHFGTSVPFVLHCPTAHPPSHVPFPFTKMNGTFAGGHFGTSVPFVLRCLTAHPPFLVLTFRSVFVSVHEDERYVWLRPFRNKRSVCFALSNRFIFLTLSSNNKRRKHAASRRFPHRLRQLDCAGSPSVRSPSQRDHHVAWWTDWAPTWLTPVWFPWRILPRTRERRWGIGWDGTVHVVMQTVQPIKCWEEIKLLNRLWVCLGWKSVFKVTTWSVAILLFAAQI